MYFLKGKKNQKNRQKMNDTSLKKRCQLYMKGCSISLFIRDIEVKTTMSTTYQCGSNKRTDETKCC